MVWKIKYNFLWWHLNLQEKKVVQFSQQLSLWPMVNIVHGLLEHVSHSLFMIEDI